MTREGALASEPFSYLPVLQNCGMRSRVTVIILRPIETANHNPRCNTSASRPRLHLELEQKAFSKLPSREGNDKLESNPNSKLYLQSKGIVEL